MGKPVKLSDRDKPWYRQSCSSKRLKAFRPVRLRILIVCEGTKTEPYYFESIGKLLPPNVVSLRIEGEGASTLSLVEKAREIIGNRAGGDYPFDKVYVVFDRDNFQPDDFDNAISSARAYGMECAWSNEAFELWYVLHFEYRDTPTSRDDFRSIISRYLGERYEKNAPDMYQKLKRLGNQQQAIAWAKRLFEDFEERHVPYSQANPCTTVYKLVEELNKYLPLAAV